MPIDQLNIRTEEIDEILGKTPNNIIRWGVSLIFIVIVALLIGSWFFKYPDTIKSTIEITTLNPPADIVAKASGKIDKMYVANSQLATEGQVLATIETPANYSDIQWLIQFLDSIGNNFTNNNDLSLISGLTVKKDMELGELQSDFSLFVSARTNLSNYIQLGYYPKKMEAIQMQIADYRVYYDYTYDQRNTMMTDLRLAEKDYRRYQRLFDSQTIPEAELEQAQSRYLGKKYAFENIRNSLANINIQISQLKNNVLDLRLQQEQQKEKLLISLNESFNNLSARLDVWEQHYVLKAPVNGICVFTKYWSSNQNIVMGEKVMTILPEKADNIIGKLLLPIRGAGKVKTGQTVNIRLHSYPYMEFGMLAGVVHSISSIPNEDFYYVEVILPEGMKTNYGNYLVFSQNMQGSAEIITNDIRLLHRVMQPIRSLIKNRSVTSGHR